MQQIPWIPTPLSRLARVAGALSMLMLACNAWAWLGGAAASVASDQQFWGADSTPIPRADYTLYSQVLPDGLTLRQYVNAQGLVFAVAWSGPVLPDMERLLGAQFTRYVQARRAQRRGVSLQEGDLVIESGGMMRAFSGRAFLPRQLPASLAEQDIR